MPSLTEKAIIESFLKLLDERPLKKITVKDIVEACGVNRNTFYYHFTDLPSLIEAVMKEDADRIAQECGGVESLQDCFSAALRFTVSHKRAVYHIYSSASRDIIERYLLDICGYVVGKFIENVSAGMDVLQEDKDLLVQFYKCECFGQVIDWLNHGMNTDMEKQFFRMCELGKGMTAEMLRRSKKV
ncbi:MAG: TetR/AcrR family transcriptional regulator [Clostridia bacterium]|nr:TetR/AcrR family transcriptional regulator [Clostridia bacterium]